jgi:Outer membrane lipoprotein/PQQ-like domain
MSAEQFLKLAEERGLLDQRVIGSLRQQLRVKGPGNVTAQQIAQLLVQKERLTKYQAAKLVDDALRGTLSIEADTLELADEDEEDKPSVTQLSAIPLPPAMGPSGLPQPKNPILGDPLGDATDQGVVDLATVDTGSGSLEPMSGASSAFTRKGPWSQLRALFRGVHGARPRQRWDSNLMLFGGGALLLLSFLGILLYFLLSQGGGDAMLDLAQADYDAQSYSQAIAKYEKFIKRYPKHPKQSLAKVRVTLAKLRRNTESQDWAGALEVAKAELPALTEEEAFGEARAELAGILPSIYEGFVSQANDAKELTEKEAFLASSKEASTLVESPEYLPSSLRRGLQDRLEGIQQAAELAQRDVDREHKLTQATAAITEAANNQEIAKAYTVRDELLQLFPSLRDNRALLEALQGLSRQEAKMVTVKEGTPPSSSEGAAPPFGPRVLLIDRSIPKPVAADGVHFALSHTTLYALAMQDGGLLWRRSLGNRPLTPFITDPTQAQSDVVIFDFRLRALLRLSAMSGKIVWQIPLSAEPLDLRKIGNAIMAPTSNQEMHVIDWETGVARVVTLPQGVAVAPGLLASTGELILPAVDSTAYILDPKTLKCREAIRWGHGKGTLQTSPTSLGNIVLFVENAGADFCWLHTWLFPADTQQAAARVGEPIRLIGNVRQPMGVSGERVAVVTDRQAIYVFQLELAHPEKPPIQVAALEGRSELPTPAFIRFARDQLLVAGQGISEYRLVASAGRLNPTWIVEKTAFSMSFPEIVDQGTLVGNFARPSSEGVTAKAVRPMGGAQGQEPLSWSTELGPEPYEEPLVSPALKGIVFTSRSGRVWVVDGANFKSGIVETSVSASAQAPLLGSPLTVGDGDLWFPARDGTPRAFRLLKDEKKRELLPVAFDAQNRHPNMVPLVFGDGILLGMREGSIHWVDPFTGKEDCVPFQPPTTPGQPFDWVRPSLAGGNNALALIAESAGGVYLLEIGKTSPPALMAAQEMTIGPKIISAISTIGDYAVAVQRTDAKDMLVVLTLTPLAENERIDLPERVVGGPWQAAGFVLLELANGELLAISDEGRIAWTSKLPRFPLAGPPLLVGKALICVSVDGGLFRLTGADGALVRWGDQANPEGILEIGETMGCGAVLFSSRLLLTSREGALFLLDAPQ